METKKYKLTEETIKINVRILYRIEALKDFKDVKKGDKGGYVEKEENLSQNGDCWVYDDARVFGNAVVCYNARVYGNAYVFGNAKVCQSAVVRDNAEVYDNARVCGNAEICGNTIVCGNARVHGDAWVCGDTEIYGNADIGENAQVCDNAVVRDNAAVFGDAIVRGNAKLYGNVEIGEYARVESIGDYIVFNNWWSSGRYFTWTRSNNMWKVGCFYGAGEQLIEKAYKDSELSGREYERVVRYVESIIKDN